MSHFKYENIRQWPVMDICDWPLVNESSWNRINREVYKIWTAALILYFSTQGSAVQILMAIIFFLSATIHLREVSYQYLWLVTGVFFHILDMQVNIWKAKPSSNIYEINEIMRHCSLNNWLIHLTAPCTSNTLTLFCF